MHELLFAEHHCTVLDTDGSLDNEQKLYWPKHGAGAANAIAANACWHLHTQNCSSDCNVHDFGIAADLDAVEDVFRDARRLNVHKVWPEHDFRGHEAFSPHLDDPAVR